MVYVRRFFAILHIHTPCPYLIGLVDHTNHMPARPLTLVLYLAATSCSDLVTSWGLYFTSLLQTSKLPRPMTSLCNLRPPALTVSRPGCGTLLHLTRNFFSSHLLLLFLRYCSAAHDFRSGVVAYPLVPGPIWRLRGLQISRLS